MADFAVGDPVCCFGRTRKGTVEPLRGTVVARDPSGKMFVVKDTTGLLRNYGPEGLTLDRPPRYSAQEIVAKFVGS